MSWKYFREKSIQIAKFWIDIILELIYPTNEKQREKRDRLRSKK